MQNPERVGIVGATGALGAEVVRVLQRVAWRPNAIVPMGRAATVRTHVEWGDEQVPVETLDADFLDDLDLVVLATSAEVAEPLASAALRAGVPVVDASGSLARSGAAPLVVPWVNPEALVQSAGAVALPSPAAMLMASVLGPLARAGIEGVVSATILEPASRSGRRGIEELSNQVVALLNSGTPQRRVFPEGLAFDLGPVVGQLDEDGWTDAEADIAREVREIVPGDDDPAVTLIRVPLFSGISANIRLAAEQNLMPGLVTRILQDGGVKVSEEDRRSIPRPRRVEGHPFAHVGRVRLSRDGDALHLWAAMDNLRTAATAAAAAGGALLQRRG